MKRPVKKNDVLTVEIIELTAAAYGVAVVDGFIIYVENVLEGERVSIRIERVEKKFAYGRVLEVIVASEDRVPILDLKATRVGTMPLQHMSYEAQLTFKQEQAIACFKQSMPDFDVTRVHKTLGMDYPLAYRNKAQIPVCEVNGVLETGFFKRGSHDLVPIEDFHIQDKEIDKAIIVVRGLLRRLGFSAYDEVKHSGCVRHVIVRKGHFTQEMMIVLVTNGFEIPYRSELVKGILEALPNVVSIVHNNNDEQTNVILGKESVVMFGEDRYYDKLLGKTYAISSRSFYQVNSEQTEVLYTKALEYAQIGKEDVVIDAYCGLGTITLSASDYAKKVYGVEVVPDAIKMAEFNATLNDVHNVEFEVGAAEDVMGMWIDEGVKPDVIIVDPPRKGLARSFIEASLKMSPRRIVYVSCNPDTLARDVAVYCERGYEVVEVQPVDMFPFSVHVETVVLMSRVVK